MQELEKFIIKAKANSWLGPNKGGHEIKSSRPGSFDVIFEEGDYYYQDSFFGQSTVCGQEHVCQRRKPVWSQAYYGYLVRPDIFDTEQATNFLKTALRSLYKEYRFLGGFEFENQRLRYQDVSVGDYRNFYGTEKIFQDGTLVFELRYFGGLVQK